MTSDYIVVAGTDDGAIELIRAADDASEVGDSRSTWVNASEWPEFVAELEREKPRWVWHDTAAWYPRLLAAGVRVERCVDLRLSHAILRSSALTAGTAFAAAPSSWWDSLRPAIAEPTAPPGGTAPGGTAPGGAGGGLPGVPFAGADQSGIGYDPLAAARAREQAGQTTLFDDVLPTPPRRSERADHARVEQGRTEPAGAAELLGELRAQRAALADATAADPAAGRIALLLAAESAGALAAAEMRHVGLPWSSTRHDAVLTELLGPRPGRPNERPARLAELLGPRPGRPNERPARLAELLQRIRDALDDPAANPDSPAELLKSLRRAGLTVSSTRSWELEKIRHPVIEPLLDYKKRARLLTANGWNWLDTWVRDGRFHPTYLPGGVVTGRWASEGGGALQLPKLVRSAVAADPGHVLVVADAAQLEPRILAALAGDRAMAAAGRGRDLYDGIVATGAVDTRPQAKLGMLGAMYGGTTGESGRMLPRLARAFPAAIDFVENAARAGEAGATVSTRLGRTSPRPGDDWLDLRDEAAADGATEQLRARARSSARSWGRFTRNFVVQGTAAEWALCWIASVRRRLWALGDAVAPFGDGAPLEHRPHLAFFLHDELVVHTPTEHADGVAQVLRESAAEAGRLIFGDAPVEFPVTVATVDSYDQAT